MHTQQSQFSIPAIKTQTYLQDQRALVNVEISKMSELDLYKLYKILLEEIQDLLQDIVSILPQQDNKNKGIQSMPSLLPFAVLQMGGRDFTAFVEPFKPQLVRPFFGRFC